MTPPLLQINNVSLTREGWEILDSINLLVQPGEIHTLFSLNGSGKSSLAYTIMGCEGYAPSAGKIIFNGQDITSLSITARARLGITPAWFM
jgi:Fe-S cluster assembly ATP-binding protein